MALSGFKIQLFQDQLTFRRIKFQKVMKNIKRTENLLINSRLHGKIIK